MVNEAEYRVIGLSRSGNHAIINWLLPQLGGRYCFLNCAEPRTSPFVSARPLETGPCHATNIPDFDPEGEKEGRFSRKDHLLYSYEDCFLTSVCHRDFERRRDRYVGTSRMRRDILILRDPFNLFASRLKSGLYTEIPEGLQRVTPGTAMRIWKQHAREFLGQRRILGRNRLLVSYNRWARERGYRRQSALTLGLEFDDSGAGKVAGCAGGSSFDGLSLRTAPEKMRVMRRWREFAHDARYLALFDPEIMALSSELFPDLDVSGDPVFEGPGYCLSPVQEANS